MNSFKMRIRRSVGRIIVSLTLLAQASFAVGAPDELAGAARQVKQIIAHRGASEERPECTLASIRRAIEVGATATEVDVRTSKDGQLFLLHDATLDRTTEGKGPANALTLAQLQRLDVGSHFDAAFKGERIPSLIEAAQVCRGKIDLLLDLKEQGDEYDQNVAAVIRKHGDPAGTIVGVRSVPQAVRFRKLLPQARQLGLIPRVEDIEAFAKARVEMVRLWPRWLEQGDAPVQRVRASNVLLHLNGTTGRVEETIELLAHRPDSLSSDNPKRQKASLKSLAEGKSPTGKLSGLIEQMDGTGHEIGISGPGERTFLNRDYKMLALPDELKGMPRCVFDGGQGGSLKIRFRAPAVVFAVFNYNETGAWSFGDNRSPTEHGWHLWRTNAYHGSSNPVRNGKPNEASIWFREYEAGQELHSLPRWWLCLGIVSVDSARNINGFKEGLVTASPPIVRIFSHADAAAAIRPLNVPTFDSAQSIRNWQIDYRKRFVEKMLYPYRGQIEIAPGKTEKFPEFEQQEYLVTLNGARLFRYFRLAPSRAKVAGRQRTIVCFMGHGKVSQILSESASYQHACAAEFARAGYLTFAMENVGMEPGADTHHDLDRALRLEGRGWYSLLFAHQRILLDRVFDDSAVDPKRVGVAGVSTGGLLALTAAAIEPRIAATSVQGIFGSMRVSFIRDRHRHCSCGAIPGLLPGFDLPEIALLVAPRAMHVSNGVRDGFSPAEAARCVKLIAPIYLQAGGALPRITVSPGGHEFDLPSAMKFFSEQLK